MFSNCCNVFLPRSNYRRLVEDCYPSSKVISESGPSYSPNSTQLSKLLHFTQTNKSKCVLIGQHLLKLVRNDSRLYHDPRKRA